jgi:hypothetical protein
MSLKPNLPTLFYSSKEEIEDDVLNHPYRAEFFISLVFIFLLGFLGSQKLAQVDLAPMNQSLCQRGISLPFSQCEVQLNDATKSNTDKLVQYKKQLVEMNQTADAPSLRTQFSHFDNLQTILEKLKWNNGDEQDAARFLSVITALENGRLSEPGMPSTASSVLDAVWNKYPDLVATSHCLNCSRFYQHILGPFFKAGSKNKSRIKQIALGHPRFLQVSYQSGQIELAGLKKVARLQAELLTSEDADTAKFIGDILLKSTSQGNNKDLTLLHHWSSKGWNGSYAVSDYHKMLELPKNILADAWQRGVLAGADNAELTRYLVSTGYRPALRWLLWSHTSDLSYFKNRTYQDQIDRYNDLIMSLYVDFPVESKDDLTGFYSKNWKSISWDISRKKWVLDLTKLRPQ